MGPKDFATKSPALELLDNYPENETIVQTCNAASGLLGVKFDLAYRHSITGQTEALPKCAMVALAITEMCANYGVGKVCPLVSNVEESVVN